MTEDILTSLKDKIRPMVKQMCEDGEMPDGIKLYFEEYEYIKKHHPLFDKLRIQVIN